MVKRQLLFPAMILLLAAIVRVAFLDIKPPHFDEGINGWFCDQMAKTGYYAYDPTNYHGPFHFYVLFVSLQLFGRNLWALRLPVVLASLLTIFWIFQFRPFLSRTVCYLAALGMAISPGFIFYDRYSIHESWLVLFLIVTFWGILGISTSREPRYFWGFILGLTGMILTKETYIIHLAAFAAAGVFVSVLRRLAPDLEGHCLQRPGVASTGVARNAPPVPKRERLQRRTRLPVRHILGAILVGLALIIFFYSGNFRYWRGLEGLYQTFLPWTKTAVGAAGHGKPEFDLLPLVPPFLAHVPALGAFTNFKLNWYWIRLLLDYEWFALAGLLFSFRFFLGGNPALRFLSIYGLGVLLIYSIVPYKTPWCIISIAWPFLFLGAALLEFIAKRLNRLVAVLVALPLFAHAAWKSYDLNFINFDTAKERYVYVQTFREYRNFVDPILEKGAKSPESKTKLSGLVLLSSYFPIPWVLGEFPNIGYYNTDNAWPEKLDADFIVADEEKAAKLEKGLKDRYFTTDFRLRDGMDECRGYFRYDAFRDIFPNRKPEFEPGRSDE
ncbi:MAG TPA: flippase activity-associated protein Agl23 [Chthoniobacterales bacterium]|jgi:uncharacterized protein (TIGR03663 family)